MNVARMIRRHRRLLAAVLAGLAVAGLGIALQPARPDVASVVVAAGDLPAGHRLVAEDLALAGVPRAITPAATTSDPGPLAGRVLGTAVAAGEAIVSTRLVGSDPVDGDPGAWRGPPGTAPQPVRFADPEAAGLLTAGQGIDVLAASASSADAAVAAPGVARLVADDVLVLAVTQPEGQDGLFAGDSGSGSPLVILATTPTQALAIAGAEANSRLTFALDP